MCGSCISVCVSGVAVGVVVFLYIVFISKIFSQPSQTCSNLLKQPLKSCHAGVKLQYLRQVILTNMVQIHPLQL